MDRLFSKLIAERQRAMAERQRAMERQRADDFRLRHAVPWDAVTFVHLALWWRGGVEMNYPVLFGIGLGRWWPG